METPTHMELNDEERLRAEYTHGDGITASSRANLTTGQVELLQVPDWFDGFDFTYIRYEKFCMMEAEKIANKEDRERYFKVMSRNALIQAFHEERTRVAIEYRRKSSNGRLIWVRVEKRLVQDEVSKDIYAYGMLRNIDEQKPIELGLGQRADRDLLTGTYNEDTTFRIMRESVERSIQNRENVVLLIFDVDKYGQQLSLSGYQESERVLKELSLRLLLKFGEPKIVGRISGDTFAVLLIGFADIEMGIRIAEDIRKTIGSSKLFPAARFPVSVSVGAAGSIQGIQSFNELFERAQEAVYMAKEAGGDCCRISIPRHSGGQMRKPQKDFLPEGLSERVYRNMRDVLLSCAYCLSSSTDFEEAVTRTLGTAARYYAARRVCLVEMAANENRIYHIYQWTEDGTDFKTDAQIKAAVEQMDREGLNRRVLHRDGDDECDGIYASLVRDGKRIGVFLVEEAGRHACDFTLSELLTHLIANPMINHQLLDRQKYLRSRDELTGLLNHYSLMRYVEGLSEETLISLGVVCIDINGLRRVNREQGMVQGDRIVKMAAGILTESYPGLPVYRISGDEFLVICENFDQSAFLSGIENLREKIGERLPSGLSIGSFWTDHDMHLEELLHYANEQLQLEKQNYYKETNSSGRHYDASVLKKVLQDIEEHRYVMYLQPKLRIESREVSGAEALVRYMDPETGLVPPDRFVPRMEQSGLIRYIDLFIFEEVCRLLADWKSRGLPLMVISLNFSRATLIQKDLLEMMERIVKRYKIPRGLLEIEITERLGVVELESMAMITDRMVELGYRLSLDDFGAQYSNLSVLSAVRFSTLKMDKTLGNDILSNPRARVVVRNVLNTCRDLGIESVAEGVENKEQMDLLVDLACDYVQGYYINKPIPVEEFEAEYRRK